MLESSCLVHRCIFQMPAKQSSASIATQSLTGLLMCHVNGQPSQSLTIKSVEYILLNNLSTMVFFSVFMYYYYSISQ